jgi:hypothetical protein
MADDNDPGTDDADLETMFEGWFQERMEREEKKKNRTRQPKDFSEFLDRVADADWERGEERAAKRRADAEDDDQSPARGTGKSKIEQWWSGERSAS